jgi:hypothetical protein
MRSCDLFGDLGQGLIVRPAILESIFCHRDVVSTAAPFANESRAWLKLRLGMGPTRPVVRKDFAIVCSLRRVDLPRPPCSIS